LWGVLIRAAAVVAVLLVVGCGGAGSGGEGDPAAVVPADAQFYAEAVVRPEGDLRDDALGAAGKVLVTDDPEAQIRRIVEDMFAVQGEDIDYERDIAPWLGERAAVWTQPTDREYEPVVVLLAATDTDAARESLEAMLARGGHEVSERSYSDSDYLVDRAGVAAGVVDDFVAIGPEALYRRTVDAAEGDSLADADEYADAVDALPDERLALFWTDMSELLDMAVRKDPVLGQLRSLASGGGLPQIAGALMANGDRLELEVQASEALPAQSTPLLQELPGGSWAAFGAGDVGKTLTDTINRFGGALGGVAIRGHVRRELGLDLDRDLLGWIGHAGFFVRGTTPEAVDGGLVIQTTDVRRSDDAFGRIVGAIQRERGTAARPVAIPGADQAFAIGDGRSSRPLVLARGSERVVAASGAAAAEAAFGTDDRLGDTDLYNEAMDLVGTEPSVLVSMPRVLELHADELTAEDRRFLEAYTVAAVGIAENTARVAVGLR
jgi:Protein of unknown function (DUF3352)